MAHRGGGVELIAPAGERWVQGVMSSLMVMIRVLVDWSDKQRQRGNTIKTPERTHRFKGSAVGVGDLRKCLFLLSCRRSGGNPVPEQQSAKGRGVTRVAVVVQRKNRTRNKHVLVSLVRCHRRRFQLVPRCPINVLTWQFFLPLCRAGGSIFLLSLSSHHSASH